MAITRDKNEWVENSVETAPCYRKWWKEKKRQSYKRKTLIDVDIQQRPLNKCINSCGDFFFFFIAWWKFNTNSSFNLSLSPFDKFVSVLIVNVPLSYINVHGTHISNPLRKNVWYSTQPNDIFFKYSQKSVCKLTHNFDACRLAYNFNSNSSQSIIFVDNILAWREYWLQSVPFFKSHVATKFSLW